MRPKTWDEAVKLRDEFVKEFRQLRAKYGIKLVFESTTCGGMDNFSTQERTVLILPCEEHTPEIEWFRLFDEEDMIDRDNDER